MNKALVFGSVGLLGIGGAVTGISYTSLNLFEKKDLIEELKSLKEEVEKYLEKIKDQVINHKSFWGFEVFLKNLIWIENASFDLDFDFERSEDSKSENALLKKNIEEENQDKNEIKNIFQDMDFFSLLIRRMNGKINQLKNWEEAKGEKFYEIREKLQKYLEDYKKNNFEKLEFLNDFFSNVNDEILYASFLTPDKSIDNLESEALIWGKKYKKQLEDLISKNEKFKAIKKDLETFLNLSIEFKKFSVFSEFFNEFLSDEIQQNINTWSYEHNLWELENE